MLRKVPADVAQAFLGSGEGLLEIALRHVAGQVQDRACRRRHRHTLQELRIAGTEEPQMHPHAARAPDGPTGDVHRTSRRHVGRQVRP
jgi:hypothetical protein